VVRVRIKVLGTESLGVRGLSCFIEYRGVKVVIDPGVALGFSRYGLHPHPIQALTGYCVRGELLNSLLSTDYVVISHLHGDHVPLVNANPFQLPIQLVRLREGSEVLLPVPTEGLGRLFRRRFRGLIRYLSNSIKLLTHPPHHEGPLSIYWPLPHGLNSSTYVAITSVNFSNLRFVHAPGSQLVLRGSVELISRLRPDVVVIDGPPIYRYVNDLSTYSLLLRKSLEGVRELVRVCDVVIIDHHVLRCSEGLEWVKWVGELFSGVANVLTAADYLGRDPLLLEAWRRSLYELVKVPNDWFLSRDSFMKYLSMCRRYYDLIMDSVLRGCGVVRDELSFKYLLKSLLIND